MKIILDYIMNINLVKIIFSIFHNAFYENCRCKINMKISNYLPDYLFKAPAKVRISTRNECLEIN